MAGHDTRVRLGMSPDDNGEWPLDKALEEAERKKKEATGNEKGKQDEVTSKLFNTPTPVSPVSGTAAAALRDLQDE